MPKTADMHSGKFLKKEDVGRGVMATIKAITRRNVAQEGAEDELKWCMSFYQLEKPLVLNVTNIQACEELFDSDDTDDWIGKTLVLYTDPTVMYAGKKTGGIRVRKPKPGTVVPAPPPAASSDEGIDADDIPF